MKKALICLMITCMLMIFSLACAAESVDQCPDCGNTDLRWYSVNRDGMDAHARFCDNCNMLVGDYEDCTPDEGTATCANPALCKTCRIPMFTSESPDPDKHDMTETEYWWNFLGFDDNDHPIYKCSASRACSRCTYYQETSVIATYAVTTPPTCTEEGVITYTGTFSDSWAGTVTNDQLTSATPTGHTSVIDEAIEATCTETGLTEGSHCGVCGVIIFSQETVPALGHTEVTDKAVKPTCTEKGFTKGKHCSVCGEILVAPKTIPALGHDYEEITPEPFCTRERRVTLECRVCGSTAVREIIPAGLHWFDLWTSNDDFSHSAHCKLCDYVGTAPCSALEVTVSDGGPILSVCPVCGQAGEAVFEPIEGAKMISATDKALPTGEAIIRGSEEPFDGALYAITVAYEYSGESIPFGTAASVSIPLPAERFSSFELVRVDVTPASENTERAEARSSVPCTFENGLLAFEADAAAIYLIIAK